MVNAAVLPVPFLARARMSRPVSAMGIDSSWMGEGRSNPLLEDAHQELAFQKVILEFVSFRRRDVLRRERDENVNEYGSRA